MHDPNRKDDRGDPNVDDSQANVLWTEETAERSRENADTNSEVEDAERDASGSPAWAASNPGMTGDEPRHSGGTADAGSGSPGERN